MSNNSIKDEKEVFAKIHENYNHLNKMMVDEMEMSSAHNVITGDYREQMWIELFRSIIPKKFSIAQGVMIIDSYGNVSKEIDIAVYDEQYTPYVFQYNTLKFIPIEAVAVVIECKSKILKPKILGEWVDTLKALEPRSCGIARIVSGYSCGLTNESQIKTRPIRILASMNIKEKDKTIIKKYEDKFDFIIKQNSSGNSDFNTFNLIVPKIDKSLEWWGNQLNCRIDKKEDENKKYSLKLCKNECIKKEELDVLCKNCFNDCFDIYKNFTKTLEDLHITDNPLLSLNFQLNQLLMLINNPMLFPHYAYANCFNKIIEAQLKANEDKTKVNTKGR